MNNPAHTPAKKDVQIVVSGRNKHGKHSPKDIARMAELLKELLTGIGCFGKFNVKATSTGLRGSPDLQGLSVVGFMQPYSIGLGYQLNDNASRCKYLLHVPKERGVLIFERLKGAAGTAYLGIGKDSETAKQLAKPLTLVPPSRVVNMAPTQPAPGVVVLAPVTESAVVTKTAVRAPTSNPVWVAEYVKRAATLAESNEYKWLTKPQVLALITELANLPSNWQAGPVFMALLSKGWLAVMPNGMYKPVIENPVPTKQNQKKSVPEISVTPVVAKVKVVPMRTKNRFATSFFSNSALQTTFFANIGTNMVPGTELTRLILDTFSHWKHQAAGHLFGYLVQEEYLVRINQKNYACGPKGLLYLLSIPAVTAPVELTPQALQPGGSNRSDLMPIQPVPSNIKPLPAVSPESVVEEPAQTVSPDGLQAKVILLAKGQRYKAEAETHKARADKSEAELQKALQQISHLQAELLDIDVKIEARAHALVNQMMNDL